MKRICLIITYTLLFSFLFQRATAHSIQWGNIDSENIYQNVCMIGVSVYDKLGNLHPLTIWSGTLIDPQAILTAANCIEYVVSLEKFFGAENVRVEAFFDTHPTITSPGKGIQINEYIVHPDYYWGAVANPHDIGLLTFKKPLKRIIPANLPSPGLLNGLTKEDVLASQGKFIVVGYGCTMDWSPSVVNYGDRFVRKYAVSKCRSLCSTWLRLSLAQDSDQDGSGACFSDSGGPVFWADQNGEPILVGITSWGDPHCLAPSFNYRVDSRQTLDFIHRTLDSFSDK